MPSDESRAAGQAESIFKLAAKLPRCVVLCWCTSLWRRHSAEAEVLRRLHAHSTADDLFERSASDILKALSGDGWSSLLPGDVLANRKAGDRRGHDR